MRGRQLRELGVTFGGELEADDSLIALIADPLDQAGPHGTVDELDDAVMTQEEVLCDIPDGRCTGVASHREEQLVLCRGQADAPRLGLAPVQEATKAVAELEETGEVLVGQSPGSSIHIVSRYSRAGMETAALHGNLR